MAGRSAPPKGQSPVGSRAIGERKRRRARRRGGFLPLHFYRMGNPRGLLHLEDVPKKISGNMRRRHNHPMGARERKRYRRIYQWRMQVHRVRRKRKARRKRLAAPHQGNGNDRMWKHAPRRYRGSRIPVVQANQSKHEAMTQQSKNTWAVIINAILTTITAILSAFGLA